MQAPDNAGPVCFLAALDHRAETPPADAIAQVITTIGNIDTLEELGAFWHALADVQPGMQSVPGVITAKDAQKAAIEAKADVSPPSEAVERRAIEAKAKADKETEHPLAGDGPKMPAGGHL